MRIQHLGEQLMNIFLKQKVTGHVGPEKHKSHGTIIDNLADYSEHMDKTYQIDEERSSDKHK